MFARMPSTLRDLWVTDSGRVRFARPAAGHSLGEFPLKREGPSTSRVGLTPTRTHQFVTAYI